MIEYPGGAPTLIAIEVSPLLADLSIDDQQQYTAIARYSANVVLDVTDTVVWSSTDPSVATVDEGGLVTVVGNGIASIVATLGGSSGSGVLFVSGGQTFLWFRYTVLEDGTDFTIPLPSSLLTVEYSVNLMMVRGAQIPDLMPVDEAPGDRELSEFRVIASGILREGDEFDALVVV